MNPLLKSFRRRAGRAAGFTLVELLVVISLILLLAGITTGLSPRASQTAVFNKNLITMANLLEQARQAAVTYQSHVYVGYLTLAEADAQLPATDKPGTYAAAFISVDGADALRSASQAEVQGDNLRFLGRVHKLPSLAFADQLPADNALASTLDPATVSKPGTVWSLRAKVGGRSALTTFNRVIKFTPQGSVRIDNAPVEAVELILLPSRGAGSAVTGNDTAQAGVIRINGLTGKVDVYQP